MGALLERAGHAAVALCLTIGAGAGVTAVLVGHGLALRVDDADRAPAQLLDNAVGYAATNITTALLILACAGLVHSLAPGSRAVRVLTTLTDPAIAISLLLAFWQVGEALGTYRLHAVAWLPHLPLELAAIALAAGGYLEARTTRRTDIKALMLAGCIAIGLLVAAAGIEAFATPITALT